MVAFQAAAQSRSASPHGPAASRINSRLIDQQILPESRTVPNSAPPQQEALREVTAESGTSDLLDNQPVECGQKKRWTSQGSRPPLRSRCVLLCK